MEYTNIIKSLKSKTFTRNEPSGTPSDIDK
ncbi:uncharacterized protein METZ01_LOCUS317693, partial [marine metagenome]